MGITPTWEEKNGAAKTRIPSHVLYGYQTARNLLWKGLTVLNLTSNRWLINHISPLSLISTTTWKMDGKHGDISKKWIPFLHNLLPATRSKNRHAKSWLQNLLKSWRISRGCLHTFHLEPVGNFFTTRSCRNLKNPRMSALREDSLRKPAQHDSYSTKGP